MRGVGPNFGSHWSRFKGPIVLVYRDPESLWMFRQLVFALTDFVRVIFRKMGSSLVFQVFVFRSGVGRCRLRHGAKHATNCKCIKLVFESP